MTRRPRPGLLLCAERGGLSTSGRRRDRGSGTVLVVGAIGVLLVLTTGGLAVVSAVVAGHRASAAADLASLAAAGALTRGESVGSACAAGSGVAGRNGGTVAVCRAQQEFTVEVEVQVPASWSWIGAARARARAGPAQSRAGP